MKSKFQLLSLLLMLGLFSYAQQDSLKITLDGTKGGAACQLAGASEAYMHSGAGTTDSASAWQVVVGNWGQADGVGELLPTGNADEWSITIHLYNYYGVDPNTDTIFAIGLVFRNGDGSMEGKDATCNDMFIRGLNTATPFVVGSDGLPWDGFTAEWVIPVGINDPVSNLNQVRSFPNPFSGSTSIRYSLSSNADNISVRILNALGQEVNSLYNGAQNAGNYSFTWDGTNTNGTQVQNGVYFYTIADGASIVTKKLMVIR